MWNETIVLFEYMWIFLDFSYNYAILKHKFVNFDLI